jgi:hypothetical protein
MTAVSSKYFSKRAVGIHLALIAWLALVVACSYWQVGRAIEGNSLSFLYAIEWPVFGVLGILGWYALLNQETLSEHQAAARREYEEMMRAQAREARERELAEEDPTLAAYNDHLEQLQSKSKKKLFGH